MTDYYDPNDGWRPPLRSRSRRQQTMLSIALEALGGGFVIATVIVGLKQLLGL